MGVGASMVNADCIALASLWEAPTGYTFIFQTHNQKHLKLEFTLRNTAISAMITPKINNIITLFSSDPR
jgi:hypothetical protein